MFVTFFSFSIIPWLSVTLVVLAAFTLKAIHRSPLHMHDYSSLLDYVGLLRFHLSDGMSQ
jgi:hypothetical protein